MMMLRGTRPLLSSSARAIASQKAVIPPLRRSPFLCPESSANPKRFCPVAQLTHFTSSSSSSSSSTKPPPRIQSERDPEEERRFGEQKLESNPQAVSTKSSVRRVFEPDDTQEEKPVSAGIKHDLDIVKDTFRLGTVPKESYVLGLAGTVPFFGTSLSTLYLSWVLNTEWPSASQFVNSLLISDESARHWLSVLEPLQLGYGAVIISFLGAVHWGLEYAEKTRDRERTRFRYGLGVLAPAVAWPTLLLPVDFALTAQFAAFVALYWADTTAARRGWAPSWYGTYRFVLTAVAGAAIALSLIGRAKVGDAKPRLTGLPEKVRERHHGEQDYDEKWEKLEAEEKKKIKKQKEEEKRRKKEEEKKKKETEEKEKKKAKKDNGGDKKESEKKDQEAEKDTGKGEEKEGGEDKKAKEGGEDKKTKEDEGPKEGEGEDGK